MLTAALIALVVLGAEPSSKAAADEPELEIVIPERMLEDFLVAAAPFDQTLTREVAVLGFTRSVKLDLTLTNPKVKVTPAGVVVTMDYLLRGPGGVTSKGVATPKLDLKAVEGKSLLEGRLSGAKLSATGGIELPVEELLEPIQFPAGATGPIPVGNSVVEAQAHAREVLLEKGKVRVKGAWSFTKPGK